MIFDQLRQIEEKQEVNALKRKYNLNLKATSYQELEDELSKLLERIDANLSYINRKIEELEKEIEDLTGKKRKK